jgi:hypothetical protein
MCYLQLVGFIVVLGVMNEYGRLYNKMRAKKNRPPLAVATIEQVKQAVFSQIGKTCGMARHYALTGSDTAEPMCKYAYNCMNPTDFVIFLDESLLENDYFASAFTEKQFLLPDFIRALHNVPVVGKNDPKIPRTKKNRAKGLFTTRLRERGVPAARAG